MEKTHAHPFIFSETNHHHFLSFYNQRLNFRSARSAKKKIPSKAVNCALKLFVFVVCVCLTSMDLLKDMGSVYPILTWSIHGPFCLGAGESSCGASMKNPQT